MSVWHRIEQGDPFTIGLLTAIGVVGVIGFYVIQRVIRMLIARRVRSYRVSNASFKDVSDLKKQGLLTEEEAKRVRAVLARQYLEEQNQPPEESPAGPGVALQKLALESEQLEQELRSRTSAKPVVQPGTKHLSSPLEEEHSTEDQLPEHLRIVATRSELEWEELLTAGFISEEDLELLRERAHS